MPSRMDKYRDYEKNVRKRTTRNQGLYKTIYDEVEYTNVEGISIIEKDEKIDINKVKELIDSANISKPLKRSVPVKEKIEPIIEDYEEKNYDIRDILSKAKNDRPEKESNNTQYDILKGINLDSNYKAPQSLSDEDLKQMIEKITNNSKSNTGDLLDDLITDSDDGLKESIQKQITEEINLNEIDRSFYTSSLGFTNSDFEDLKELKDDIKKNKLLTKVLLFILLVILCVGIMFFI